MARRVDAPRRRPPLAAVIAAIGAVLVVGLVGAMVIFGGGESAASPAPRSASSTPSLVAVTSPSPSAIASLSVPSATPMPSPSASQSASSTPTTSASASATTPPPPDGAPQSAAEFDLHGQVIDIAFPLRADTEYHYRDNWYERRDGPPDSYNHARTTADGEVVRLHDGIDIYAPENEPVLSPFDGVVIDPATKWTPWEPDRYGLTVVVESDESTSPGYTAVLVHLDKVWVEVGQHVTRAPFLINWS